MVYSEHIETQQAAQLRSQRRRFAAPGGFHDKFVRFLGAALPMGAGVMAALMVIAPLSPRGEVSFLLDRNKVAVVQERFRVENAMYRGQDNGNRPFSILAKSAAQRTSAEGLVRMADLRARIILDGGPAQVSARSGVYAIADKIVRIFGPAYLTTSDGYAMQVSGVAFDLNRRQLRGDDGVSGTVPSGQFSAQRILVDAADHRVVLDGSAHLTMVPGRMRSLP